MPRWLLDASRTPVLVVHLDDASGLRAPEFDTLLTVLDEVKDVAAERPTWLVLDLSGARPDAQRRRRLVTWIQQQGPKLREDVRALAVVAPSAFLRGAFIAVHWFFSEHAHKSQAFETREQAHAWIDSMRG